MVVIHRLFRGKVEEMECEESRESIIYIGETLIMIVNKKIIESRAISVTRPIKQVRCEHNSDDDDYGDDFPPSVSPFDNFSSRTRTSKRRQLFIHTLRICLEYTYYIYTLRHA